MLEVRQGYAKMIDPGTVEIALNYGGIQHVAARSIVISAGASPFVPPLPGIDESGYLTSDTLWDEFAKRDEIPKRLVVLGGGPIGCELSQSFARLGSEVIQIERADRIMRREDQEVSELAKDSLESDRVLVLNGHTAWRCEKDGDSKFTVVKNERHEQRYQFFIRDGVVGLLRLDASTFLYVFLEFHV